MAQTYTLDEAANRLGIGTEELKRRLRDDWKTIRSFRDGATLRFRSSDIDDLARTLGQASDPVGVQPGSKPPAAQDEFLLPAGDSDSSEEVPINLSAAGSGKKKGDSDVRLEPASPKQVDPNEHQLTDEIALDLSGPGSGKAPSGGTGKITAPKSGKISGPADGAIMSGDSSSEFELALDSDSDSFELELNTGSGDKPSLGAKGGIELSKPADSGIPLTDSDESMEFELSLDAPSKSAPSSKKATMDDSDSEFELALDENSGVTDNLAASMEDENKGDIFETDFELPAVDDSGSEVIAVEDSGENDAMMNSDFDLALDESDIQVEDDESASQVVLIDDEDAPVSRSGAGRGVAAGAAAIAFDDDDDEGSSVGTALRGVDRDDLVAVTAGPTRWGAMPSVVLLLTLPFVVLGGIMSYELLRSMNGTSQPLKPSAPVVRGVAGMLGMEPKEKN